jgi:hypothetical protein
LFACLASSAVALAQSSPPMSPMTAGQGPTQAAIQAEAHAEAQRREARREWLHGTVAREQRERSRIRHRGIGADAARSLVGDAFDGLLEGLLGPGASLARDGRFLEFFDDYTAQVRVGDGSQVVRSWLPLRVRDADGEKRPVDLSLREIEGGFEPRVPLVPVSLPASLDKPVRVGSERIPVWVEGTRAGAAARDGASRLFYWETSPDTDVVVLPTQMGVEVLWQIRGPQSPEEFSLRFDLRRAPSWSARRTAPSAWRGRARRWCRSARRTSWTLRASKWRPRRRWRASAPSFGSRIRRRTWPTRWRWTRRSRTTTGGTGATRAGSGSGGSDRKSVV